MGKKSTQIVVDEQGKEKINQFRQELDQELDDAIEHHEFKMVYIGILTLVAFASLIYLSVKFQLPFFN